MCAAAKNALQRSPRECLPSRKWNVALVGLLLASAIAHFAFGGRQPAPRPTGDELHYIQTAFDDVARGRTLALPGFLRFGHRPELASRLLATWVEPRMQRSDIVRRASVANGLLLLSLIALVFWQARACGASEGAAWLAAASVAAFPWLAFHVHSLWPEVLHAACFGAALYGVLLHLRRGRLGPLAAAGVASGVALLAKGTLGPFVPLIALYCAGAAWRRCSAHSRRERAALVVAGVYLGAILLVVGPQLAANASAGHGLRLAANTWWNLELGITLPVDPTAPGVQDASGRWLPAIEHTQRYAAAAPRAVERELAARGRTLDYVARQGAFTVAAAQLGKLLDLWLVPASLLPQRRSSFDQALGPAARWGAPAPQWIEAWRSPARWAWRLLFPLGLLGLVWGARDSPQRLFLALFALSFLAAAAAVPVKVRFLLPLVPVLALGLGFLWDRSTRSRSKPGAGAAASH